MRYTLLHLSAGLVSLLGLATAVGADDAKAGKAPPANVFTESTEASCHGTSVDFVDTPSEAARKAKKEEKLVFILHVSGNFEDPKYT